MTGNAYLRAVYWGTLRFLKRVRYRQIGSRSRIAWGARLRGAPDRIVIGRDCWLDDDSLLDARGGGRIALGDGAQLHRFAFLLTHGGNITFGTNCSVNSFSILYGHGGLLIGDNVRIAAHVVIIPANHRFDRTDVPIAEQGVSAQGIVVEDDVWIGTGARILDGCHVGRGSVIGAGAVVSHDIEPYSIAVGIPAKRVGSRLG